MLSEQSEWLLRVSELTDSILPTFRIIVLPVVAVRTKRPYKTTEGQYSPVRLEQSRLVSNLLHTALGQNLFILSINSTSGLFNSKGFRRDMFLMTRATKKDQASTSLKTNSFSVKSQETVFILSSETEM